LRGIYLPLSDCPHARLLNLLFEFTSAGAASCRDPALLGRGAGHLGNLAGLRPADLPCRERCPQSRQTLEFGGEVQEAVDPVL